MQIQNFKDIHFTISGEGSKYIVFLHGNSLSSEAFKYQFQDVQLNKYKLLAIDFPGHGKSGWSENKEKDYSLFGFRDAVVEIIQDLKIEDFIFAGHSLGGHVAIECLPQCKKCKGIMVWGTPPVTLPLDTSQLFLPNPDMDLLFKLDLSEEELAKLGKIILNDKKKDFIKEIIKQADPQFRSWFPQSLANGKLSDEVAILKSSGIPIAILHGKDDPLVNLDYLVQLDLPNIWKKKILLFENSEHSIQLDNSDEFNQILIKFADHTF